MKLAFFGDLMRAFAGSTLRFSGVAVLLLNLLIMPGLPAASQEPEPRYDTTTVVDLFAVVNEVRETGGSGALSGIHLLVKPESGPPLDVYLGPADFLKEFDITFHKGDRVQVIGSKVKSGNSVVILAREVRRDERTLYLRDRRGTPNWAPRRIS
jgi:hypothetical protein